MTALASNTNRTEKIGKLVAMKVKGGANIFHNALVMIGADGYLAPCASEAGAVYAGMAYEACDNSEGADGELVCRVERHAAIECAGARFVQADMGKKVYAADDNTVQLAAGTDLPMVGVIIEVISATKVLVAQMVQLRFLLLP